MILEDNIYENYQKNVEIAFKKTDLYSLAQAVFSKT
jgi:hypothetical protein